MTVVDPFTLSALLIQVLLPLCNNCNIRGTISSNYNKNYLPKIEKSVSFFFFFNLVVITTTQSVFHPQFLF